MNVTLFGVRFWGAQYREELIMNVNVLVVRVWEFNRERNLYSILLCLL